MADADAQSDFRLSVYDSGSHEVVFLKGPLGALCWPRKASVGWQPGMGRIRRADNDSSETIGSRV